MQRVVARLREWGGQGAEEVVGREENVVFALPRELRPKPSAAGPSSHCQHWRWPPPLLAPALPGALIVKVAQVVSAAWAPAAVRRRRERRPRSAPSIASA